MIRDATLDDIPTLITLAQAFVQMCPWIPQGMDPASTASLFAACITHEQSTVLVAEDECGGLVGMLGAVCTPALFDVRLVVAQELAWYVREEARHAQHGANLYQAFRRWAQGRGAHAISMAVLQTSMPSVAGFLRSQGFQQAETAYILRVT